MRELVEAARVARLATLKADGRPRLVPCVFALDGDTLHSAVDAKPKRTQELARLADIEADPRVALLVDHYDDHDWAELWWVRLEGRGRVLRDGAERDAALDRLAAKYAQYRNDRPAGPVIAVDIESWSGWSAFAGG